MPQRNDGILEKFLRGEVANEEFHHAEHVRVAFEMLRTHGFVDAARLYADGLRAICARAGRPNAYHETITIAFLSLVSERMSERRFGTFDEFAAANADLMNKSVLSRWYTGERLQSEIARRTFVLPLPREVRQ